MRTMSSVERLPTGWLPRATLSGLIASVAMLATFFVAYGLASAFAALPLAERRGASMLAAWLYGLTHNQLIDFAQSSLYLAIVLFFVGGVAWAVVYAAIFEPRLSGPAWLRGLVFSLVPGFLSLIVFLPIVGGGLFGLALGAGPFPIVGNLVMHAVYGLVLGVVYSPLGDLVDQAEVFAQPTPSDVRANLGAEQSAMVGLLVGVVVGLVAGVAAEWAFLASGQPLLGLPVGALTSILVLVSAAFGAMVGSLAGLPAAER